MRVKAALLFTLLPLIDWQHEAPPASPEQVAIIFVGPDAREIAAYFESSAPLDRLENIQVGVRYFLEPGDIADDSPARILYFSGGSCGKAPGIWAERLDGPVLTIGDDEDFCAWGGMVGLVEVGGRIKLQVNPGELEKAGIRLGAECMQHAQLKHTLEQEGGS